MGSRHTTVPLTRRTLLTAAAGSLWLGPVPAARAAVVAAQRPAKIDELEFDPRRPPQSLPAIVAPETGACDYRFGLEFPAIDYVYEPFAEGRLIVRVDGLSVVTTLEIDLWVPRGARRNALEHLAGHRQICERCYEGAEALAQAAATPLVGRRVVGRGASESEARQDALARVRSQVDESYRRGTAARCATAQTTYDALTEHGAAEIAVAEAVRRALESAPPA